MPNETKNTASSVSLFSFTHLHYFNQEAYFLISNCGAPTLQTKLPNKQKHPGSIMFKGVGGGKA